MNYKIGRLISSFFPIIAAILLVIAGVGVYWLYQNSQPRYTTVMNDITLYSYEGGFSHCATVTENNALWPVGMVLENKRTYFLSITPEFEPTFRFELSEAESTSGRLRSTVDLNIQSVREGEVYWSETRKLTETSWDLSEMNFELELSPLNIAQIKDRVEEIQDSLRFSSGATQANIIVKVVMDGTIDGDETNRSETYQLPIVLGRTTYSADKNIFQRKSTTEFVEKEVKKDAQVTASVLPLIFIAGPLLILGYVSFEKWQISKYGLEKLSTQRQRNRYGEWISEGKLTEPEYKNEIEFETLEDLIDAAVDMGRRIIHDEEKSKYFFIEEGNIYTFKEI